MNPNHYLAVAIQYLYTHRDGWAPDAAIGKTLVSSSMIDRVAASLGRRLWEVPVGFKWFVPGLVDGSVGFGGEESAGASFLQLDGQAWTTDKDGILLALLAREILAVTGKSAVAAVRRADRRVRRSRLRAGGCRGEQGAEGAARQAVGLRHHGADASPASRSPRACRRRPATVPRSAA